MNHLSISPPDAEITKELMSAPWVAMDTEFDGPRILKNPHKRPSSKNRLGPDQLRARLVGFSLWYPGCPWPEGVYIPVSETYGGAPVACQMWLRVFLKLYPGQLWFHNALADITVLTNQTNQLPFPSRACDSMLLAYCLGKRPPGAKEGLSLDALIRRDLGVEGGKSFHDTFGGRGAGEVPPEEMAPYAAKDAWYTGRLVEKYLPELDAQPKLRDHVFNVEMPLLRTVHQMFVEGVRVDSTALNKQEHRLAERCRELDGEFRTLTETYVDLPVKVKKPTGEYFKNGKPKMKTVEELQPQLRGASVSSDQQVRRWMYDELKWWPTEDAPRTDSGLCSVAADDIERFVHHEDPLAAKATKLRLQFKKLDKMRGTYIAPLPAYSNKYGDGRVHANMHQTGTETGRFSSSGPNLQNLPRPSESYYGEELPNIREAIVPREGYVLLCADYAQLELRILAHLSKDPALCAAFVNNEDPHQATRDTVLRDYGLEIDRTQAKTTIFGIMYGQGAGGLSHQLGVSKKDALNLIQGVYRAYPKVRDYQTRAVAYARKHNCIPTLGGFVRQLDYAPGGCTQDGARQPKQRWCPCEWCKKASHEDRKAKNTPVQGSAGVLMKKAMVELEREWRGGPNKILMQVHDELLCEVPDDEYRMGAKDDLVLVMEDAMSLRVPLVAEAKIGGTWAELK